MLPPFMITPLYAALCGLLLIVLALRVVRLRQRHGVGIGDGGQKDLAKAIRVHANFVEYVPMALLLLFLLELTRQPAWALHLLGAALFLGRILHAWGLSRTSALSNGRAVGIVMTFLVIVITSVWLLLVTLQRLTG